MRQILLAAAAIGAVSAVALSVSSKPFADSGNHFNVLPTGYSIPAGADPNLSGAPSTGLAPPAPNAAAALVTAAVAAESTAGSPTESSDESTATRERVEHVRRG